MLECDGFCGWMGGLPGCLLCVQFEGFFPVDLLSGSGERTDDFGRPGGKQRHNLNI